MSQAKYLPKIFLTVLLILTMSVYVFGCTSSKDVGTKDVGTKDVGTKDAVTKDVGTKDVGTKDVGTKEEKVPVYKLTMGGGSPGGLWTMLGEGVSNAIAKSYPNSVVSYEPSNGIANVGMVEKGQFELALTHNIEARAALLGEKPYEAPVKDFYALGVMYNWFPYHFLISNDFAKKYNINSISDIAKNKPPIRISVNQLGNMNEAINRWIFEELYGFTYDDVKSWGGQIVYAPSGETVELMKARRLDVNATGALSAPHSSYIETGRSVDVKLLSLTESDIVAINEKWGTDFGVIKAGTYEWQEEEIQTFALAAIIIISKDVPDETAYNLAKALVENISEIQKVHQSMNALTPEILVNQVVVPFHPGAEKYYKEIGLIK